MAEGWESNFAARIVKRLGSNSCLIDAATGESFSPELATLICGFGAGLRANGLQAQDRILIACNLSPASAIAYLGAMYAGLVAVPVEESVLTSRVRELIDASGAKAVWSEKPIGFGGAPAVVPLHGLNLERGAVGAPAPCTETDLAALIATSGSTGTPRLVMVSHGNLIANTEAIIRSQGLTEHDRAMLILPLSYCFGASVLHTHLYQGGGVIFDRRFMFPDKVLHAIGRHECTTFAGVPTVYNILLRRSHLRTIAMPSLRRCLQAGGPLRPDDVKAMRAALPQADFYVMYGQTEATARISCLAPGNLDAKLGSVGRPLDNLRVRIVGEGGRNLAAGESGELLVSGPSIASGYFGAPEASQSVFERGWLRTGDLAHLDSDGYLWIDGRKGSFIKMRGIRLSFAEVEAKVAAVPGVYECAAAAVPHQEVGEALALYIVADRGAREVAERVRQSLPLRWTCESIRIVSAIPKTASGKVAREALR